MKTLLLCIIIGLFQLTGISQSIYLFPMHKLDVLIGKTLIGNPNTDEYYKEIALMDFYKDEGLKKRYKTKGLYTDLEAIANKKFIVRNTLNHHIYGPVLHLHDEGGADVYYKYNAQHRTHWPFKVVDTGLPEYFQCNAIQSFSDKFTDATGAYTPTINGVKFTKSGTNIELSFSTSSDKVFAEKSGVYLILRDGSKITWPEYKPVINEAQKLGSAVTRFNILCSITLTQEQVDKLIAQPIAEYRILNSDWELAPGLGDELSQYLRCLNL